MTQRMHSAGRWAGPQEGWGHAEVKVFPSEPQFPIPRDGQPCPGSTPLGRVGAGEEQRPEVGQGGLGSLVKRVVTQPAQLPQPFSGSDWTQPGTRPQTRAPPGDVSRLLSLWVTEVVRVSGSGAEHTGEPSQHRVRGTWLSLLALLFPSSDSVLTGLSPKPPSCLLSRQWSGQEEQHGFPHSTPSSGLGRPTLTQHRLPSPGPQTQGTLYHASTSQNLSLEHPSRGQVSRGNPLRFLGLGTHFP